MIGEIKEFTSIWHRGVCPNRERHPVNCVHKAVSAKDLSNVPKFLFLKYFGTFHFFYAIKRWGKNKFNLKSDIEKFQETPIETPEFILKDSINKKVLSTIRAIQNLSSGGEYDVNLIYFNKEDPPEVIKKKYKVRFKETAENYFGFQIILPEFPDVGGVEHQESYGLNRQLFLVNETETISVGKNSVTDFSTKYPYLPQILRGRFTQLNQIVESNYENVFMRLVIPLKIKKPKLPTSILERKGTLFFDKEEFNIKDSLMGVKLRLGTEYSELRINGLIYHCYSVQESLLIIECLNKTDIDSFKETTKRIRLGLAFLSGDYYSGETYYLSSHNDDFDKIEGVWYEKEFETKRTKNQIINPLHFFQSFRYDGKGVHNEKHKKHHKMFSSDLFSLLCMAMLDKEEEILRTVQLVVSGSANPDPIQKGALYSVAIETITNYLSEKNGDKIKPIKDKAISKSVRKDFNSILSGYKEAIGEKGITILTKKIENLNSPTNRDKLIKPFEILGIELCDDDVQAIGKRNDYLHGRIPLEDNEEFELEKLALKLHFLVSCLVLKWIGYEGHIIYLPIWAIMKDEEKSMDLYLSRTEQEMLLFEELRKSMEAEDQNRFEELKLEAQEFYKAHEMNNLIRII